MMAKLDAMSHCWVASLANYNFQLYYRVGKTNIDVDALLRVSWPDCMPNASGTNCWVTAVTVCAMQEATLKGPASPIEAYSCDLHVLDLVEDGSQVACMTTDEWHQAQWADSVLGLVITRMQDGILGQCPLTLTDPPKLWQFLWECNHLTLRQGILCRKTLPKESQEALFQLVLLAAHSETTLKCTTMKWATWVWNGCLTWCMTISFGLTWLLRWGNTCQEVLLVHHFQGKATKGPIEKYCGHPSLGTSAPQLLVPRTREG